MATICAPALPHVALMGAGLVLASDIVGRLIRFPYEIPLGTIMGVVGAVLFLYLLSAPERGQCLTPLPHTPCPASCAAPASSLPRCRWCCWC